MDWYFEVDGEQHGPVSDDCVRELIRDGGIAGDTLIWRPGMSEWSKAEAVPGFLHPPPLQEPSQMPDAHRTRSFPIPSDIQGEKKRDGFEPKGNQEAVPSRTPNAKFVVIRFLGVIPLVVGLLIAMKENLMVGTVIAGIGMIMFGAGPGGAKEDGKAVEK